MKISGQFADPLSRALRKHYPNIKVVRWGSVRKMIGDDNMLRYLASVRQTGLLEPAHLDSLAAAIRPYAQHLIIQRIESDELQFSKSPVNETIDGREVHTEDRLETVRRMTVLFGLYDLDQRKLVWSATVQREASTSRSVRPEADLDIDGLLGLVIDVTEALDGQAKPAKFREFPEPESQIKIMTLIYGEFAENLPKD
jgi:hypothetical protein